MNINNKMIKRKRLLNTAKRNTSVENNSAIKSHFNKIRSSLIRKSIVPSNSKSLWKAVKIAKDINKSKLREIIRENKYQSQMVIYLTSLDPSLTPK